MHFITGKVSQEVRLDLEISRKISERRKGKSEKENTSLLRINKMYKSPPAEGTMLYLLQPGTKNSPH